MSGKLDGAQDFGGEEVKELTGHVERIIVTDNKIQKQRQKRY